jgi:dipeptidyl aminopeptidase/acylaminoacyl peptidase
LSGLGQQCVYSNYAVYYSLHQYFLEMGYIVFAPDYRGSIGHGRDWRTGVSMDIGGKDAKDAWMSANFLKSCRPLTAAGLGSGA